MQVLIYGALASYVMNFFMEFLLLRLKNILRHTEGKLENLYHFCHVSSQTKAWWKTYLNIPSRWNNRFWQLHFWSFSYINVVTSDNKNWIYHMMNENKFMCDVSLSLFWLIYVAGLSKWISISLPSQLSLLLRRTSSVRFNFFFVRSHGPSHGPSDRITSRAHFAWEPHFLFILSLVTDAGQGFLSASAIAQSSGTSLDCAECRALWCIQVLVDHHLKMAVF